MWPPTWASAKGIWWSPRPDVGGRYAIRSGKKRRRRKRPAWAGRSGPSGGPGENGDGPSGRARELYLPPVRRGPAPPSGCPLLQDRLPRLRFSHDPAVQRPRRRNTRTRTGGRSLSKTRRRPGRLHRVPRLHRRLPRGGHRDEGRQSLYPVRPMHQLPDLYSGLPGGSHKVAEESEGWQSGRPS
jgi:hypothetical protein